MEDNDAELIRRANRGDENAMERLYKKYREWVFALSRRYCANREDALDVMQESFIAFFNRFPGLELRCNVKTFLYPIIRNNALNLMRKRKRGNELPFSLENRLADNHETTGKQLLQLREWLETLPADEREIMMLRFHDGYTMEETSKLLNIPTGTIKSKIHRMLKKIRENFKL